MRRLILLALLLAGCTESEPVPSAQPESDPPFRSIGGVGDVHRIIDQQTGNVCYLALSSWNGSVSIFCVPQPQEAAP